MLCFAGFISAQNAPAAPKKEIKTATADVEKPVLKEAKEVRSKTKKETKVMDPVQLNDAKNTKKVVKKVQGATAKNQKQ